MKFSDLERVVRQGRRVASTHALNGRVYARKAIQAIPEYSLMGCLALALVFIVTFFVVVAYKG